MTIGKLIEEILTEIGFATDGGSISDSDSKRCLSFINEAILELNRNDYLHFTKDLVTLPRTSETEFIIEGAPLKVDSLTFVMSNNAYRVKPVMLTAFVNYLDGSFGRYPRAFTYDRIFKDGALVGRLRIDRASDFQLNAVVTNNMACYTDNTQVINLPADYMPLIKADVQYKLLSNSGADEALKRSKAYEYTKIKRSIKESVFVGIDNAKSVDYLDVIHTGAGRL